MNQRKTLTLSQDFYESLKQMETETKHAVTDAVFDLFFEKKQPKYDEYPNDVRLALACLMPSLRKIQQKFDAGVSEKKFTAISKGGVCPHGGSEMKRNEAKRSAQNSSDNIYNIYNNILNQSINQSASYFKNKTTLELCSEIVKVLERLRLHAPEIHWKIVELIIKVSTSGDELYKINKVEYKVTAVLKRILLNLKPLVPGELQAVIESIYTRMATRPKINNKQNYILASLFNIEPERVYVGMVPSEQFPQRTYTPEEANAMFDNLDELDIL